MLETEEKKETETPVEMTAAEVAAAKKLQAEKEAEDAQHKAAYTVDTQNGIRPDSMFKSDKSDISFIDLTTAEIDRSFKRIQAAKSLDDMAMAIGLEFILAPLEFLTEYLKAKTKENKEKAKKAEEKRADHYTGALKNRDLTLNALASRVAYRTQAWLTDTSMMPKNADGTIKTTGLNKAQRYNLRKLKFAEKLPLIAGTDMYDFKKFSSSQKKQYAKYMMTYATQNPAFRKYVESMMEVAVTSKELQDFAKMGTEMNLKHQTGLMYHRNRDRSMAA